MREIMGQRSLRAAWYSGVCPLWSNAGGAIGGAGVGCFPGKVHKLSPGKCSAGAGVASSRYLLVSSDGAVARRLDSTKWYGMGAYICFGGLTTMSSPVIVRPIITTPIPCERSYGQRSHADCMVLRVHPIRSSSCGTIGVSGNGAH